MTTSFPSQPERRLILASYGRLKDRHNGNLGDQLFRCLLAERPQLSQAFANNAHSIRRHSFLAQETLDMILELVGTAASAEDVSAQLVNFAAFHSFSARRQPVLAGDWTALESVFRRLVLDSLDKRGLEERRLRRLWLPLLHFIVACLQMGHRQGWEQPRGALSAPATVPPVQCRKPAPAPPARRSSILHCNLYCKSKAERFTQGCSP